jgi:hypothetical protein
MGLKPSRREVKGQGGPEETAQLLLVEQSYQTQRSAPERTMGEPGMQLKACAKGGKFDMGLITRNFETGCGHLAPSASVFLGG